MAFNTWTDEELARELAVVGEPKAGDDTNIQYKLMLDAELARRGEIRASQGLALASFNTNALQAALRFARGFRSDAQLER